VYEQIKYISTKDLGFKGEQVLFNFFFFLEISIILEKITLRKRSTTDTTYNQARTFSK
jgi:hypothetical protein